MFISVEKIHDKHLHRKLRSLNGNCHRERSERKERKRRKETHRASLVAALPWRDCKQQSHIRTSFHSPNFLAHFICPNNYPNQLTKQDLKVKRQKTHDCPACTSTACPTPAGSRGRSDCRSTRSCCEMVFLRSCFPPEPAIFWLINVFIGKVQTSTHSFCSASVKASSFTRYT